MKNSVSTIKSFLFDLYFKPSLLLIASYQIVVSGTFTAQQLLLAAYLDELGYLESQSLISGLIISIFFAFWFLLAPICGTLSDLHGRKGLMIVSNLVSGIAFFGFIATSHTLYLLLINGILGIGSSLRMGSVIALWVQHSPKNRIGESMAYINIVLVIGGILFAGLGFWLWVEIREISFFIIGALLIITAVLILPVSDDGNYTPFSITNTLDLIKRNISEKRSDIFFLRKQFLQLSIHWFAISAIVSFGTFMIPIFDRFVAELPTGFTIPFPLLIIIGSLLVLANLSGLIIWGWISDNWARKPVLIIGFSSTGILVLLLFLVFQLNQLTTILQGMISGDVFALLIIGVIICLIFMMISLIPTPLALSVDLVGKENVAKAMSLRQALIALGTIGGTIIGGMILGSLGLSGLFLLIFFFLAISTVILL
jgi:MFS family permease